MGWFILKVSIETEFFDDIFEEFVCLEESFKDSEIWKSTSIIKLMKVSDEIENKHMIADGLKIILGLYKFKECGSLIDSYELESYSSNNLVELEKNIMDSILKAEFI